MNFLVLKYFRVVAEELNITHASRRLYISQQALSSHIRNLEEELGVSLFNRSPRLSLTDAGNCLYEATKEIANVTSQLNDKLNEIRKENRGELRIGISFTRGQFFLPHIIPQYSLSYPKVRINIFEESSQSLFARLLRGEIDFWITADQPQVEGFVMEPLFTERFNLIVPVKVLERTYGAKRAEELRKKIKESLDLRDLMECPFVLLNSRNRSRELFDDAMRANHLVPNIILETDNSQTAFALAQRDMALTIYSEMFLKSYSGKLNPDVEIVSLEKYLKEDLLHIYYAEGTISGFRQSFLNEVHRIFG